VPINRILEEFGSLSLLNFISYFVEYEYAMNSFYIPIIKWGREDSDLRGSIIIFLILNRKIFFHLVLC
jgi:hypothetical protein